MTFKLSANGRPLGYSQITSLTAAAGLGTIPAGTRFALIQPEGADVRWRDDGTNPTASVGMILPVGAELTYAGKLDAFKAIRVAAGAILNVSFFGKAV